MFFRSYRPALAETSPTDGSYLHCRQKAIQEAHGERERLAAEPEEAAQGEKVFHLEVPHLCCHPHAVVVGRLQDAEAAQFRLTPDLLLQKSLQLQRKGQSFCTAHCVNHLGGKKTRNNLVY